MLKMRRVVIYLCLLMLFVVWGSKDAYAAEDVSGYKKAVTTGIINRVDTVDVEQYGIQRKNLSKYYYDAIYESPYCFIVNNPSYGYNGNDIVTYMRFDYKYTKEQVKNFYSNFNKEVNTIVSAAKNMSALEKILYVHDYFVANFCYDCESYEKYTKGDEDAIPDEHYTAIGVMVNKTGVCQGYALAFNYVMSKLGVESHMMTSDSMNHAWNIVKLNGYYYHIDATWDDPVYDTAGKVEHEYFLLSDAKMKELGYSGYNKSLYPANSKKYDKMFWRDVKSAFTYYKNKWYYIGSDGVIYIYDVNKNSKQKIYTLPDKKWSVVGNSKQYYVGIFSTFRVHNGNLYFNTKSKIYKLNVNTKKASVAVSPSTKNGYIYGMAYINGKVCYQLKTKPSGKGALYSCNQSVVVSTNAYFNATKVCEMRDISTCQASGSAGIYTGKAVTPNITIKCGGVVLVKNVDYTIKYSNNVNLGKGYITITGKGNYSGTKKFSFNIVLNQVKNLGTKARTKNAIKIGWSKVDGAKQYWVYRYNASTKKYVCIAKTASNSYTNKGLSKNKIYYYKVVAVNGNNKGAASAQLKTYTSKK